MCVVAHEPPQAITGCDACNRSGWVIHTMYGPHTAIAQFAIAPKLAMTHSGHWLKSVRGPVLQQYTLLALHGVTERLGAA